MKKNYSLLIIALCFAFFAKGQSDLSIEFLDYEPGEVIGLLTSNNFNDGVLLINNPGSTTVPAQEDLAISYRVNGVYQRTVTDMTDPTFQLRPLPFDSYARSGY